MAITPLQIPDQFFGQPIPVAPDMNEVVDKVDELVAAVNAGLATSNAIVGGPKFVRYRLSQLYGVPADALTLDRLDPATILPGNLATVINSSDNPTQATAPSKGYVATLVAAGTAGAVLVPAFTGSADRVSIDWQEVVDNNSFTALLVSEIDASKKAYAGLALRPLLIALVNGIGTGTTTTVTTSPATTAPAPGPTVTGFLPGAAVVGASVTITGTGFTRALSVLFNGTAASFQVLNATTIVAVVPVGATTGPVPVATATGTGTSAANFTVSATTTPTPVGDTTPPSVTFTVPAAGATLPPNSQVLLTVIANDNVAVAGLTFTNGLTGALIGAGIRNGSTYTFAYTTPATAGPLSLVSTATDATGNSQSATVSVTISSGTTTPTPDLTAALAISLATLTLGASVAYSVTPAGGTAPYGYEVVATDTATGQQFTLGTTKTGSWTPAAVGSFAIESTINDSSSPAKAAQSATRYLQVVAAANRIPVVNAGQDVTMQLPTSSVALMGTASDPDTGDTLTNVWRQITGPNSATGLPATTLNVVASGLIAGTYQFGFTATDNHGVQSVEDFVMVSVAAASVPVGRVLSLNVEGDSLSSPRELSAEWFAQTKAVMQSAAYIGWNNFAVAGETILNQMNSAGERNQVLAAKSSTAQNVLFQLAGMNDLQAGYSELKVFNLIRDQIGYYSSQGYMIAVLTITTSRVVGSGYDHLEFWQRIQKLNNLLRSGFNDGSLPISVLMDTMTDPVLGTFNSPLNSTYFLTDQIHYGQPAGHARIAAFAKRALPYLLAGTKKVINYASESDVATIQPLDTTGTGTGGVDPAAERVTLDSVSSTPINGTSTLVFNATKYNSTRTIEYSLDGTTYQSSNTFAGVPNGTYPTAAARLVGTTIKGVLSITVSASAPVYNPLRYGTIEAGGIFLPDMPARTVVTYVNRATIPNEAVYLADLRQVLYNANGTSDYITTSERTNGITYYVNGNGQNSLAQTASLTAVFSGQWVQLILEGASLALLTLFARFTLIPTIYDQNNIATNVKFAPISVYNHPLSDAEKAALNADQPTGTLLAYYSLKQSSVVVSPDSNYSNYLLDDSGNGHTAKTVGNVVLTGAP